MDTVIAHVADGIRSNHGLRKFRLIIPRPDGGDAARRKNFERILRSVQQHPTLNSLQFFIGEDPVVDCTDRELITRYCPDSAPDDDASDDQEDRNSHRHERVQLSRKIVNTLKMNKKIHQLWIPGRNLDREIVLKQVHSSRRMSTVLKSRL